MAHRYCQKWCSTIFKQILNMEISLPKIFKVSAHTDHIGKGSTFVAIKGTHANGANYIPLALEKGATTIVIEMDDVLDQNILKKIENSDVSIQRVKNARLALAQLSSQAYNYPAQKLQILGVTGTKGKTTTVHILEHILKKSGVKTALLSTVGNRIGNKKIEGSLTTPLPDYLHVFFDICLKNNINTVIMEVSAQALSLYRLTNITFDGIIFTNFDQEHAEFYTTLDDYFQAKCKIFDHVKPQAPVVINVDDQRLKKLLNKANTSISFSCNTKNDNPASYKLKEFKTNLRDGSSGMISHQQETVKFSSPLIGEFNAYNILGTVSLLHQLGVSWDHILNGLKTFRNVPGRFHMLKLPNNAYACIDYAHTPSSFEAILSLLSTLTPDLIVIFGCGGDRDKIKRPKMGEIASRYAQRVYLTTDNPRSEKTSDIIHDIMQGVSSEYNNKIFIELDREKAILLAYQYSKPNTIIALLGKGPDEYQIIGNTKIPFSEHEILSSLK